MKKLFALFLILGCTTAQQQPAATSTPAAATQSQFKNLQVFPKDIPREDLLAAMRGFTRGLGVKCNHCHVVTATEPKEVLDFPSDAKEEKRAARVMVQMAAQINGTWLPRVEAAEHPERAAEILRAGPTETRVSCWTCHRGKPEPETPPPPAPAPTTSR